MTSNYTEKRDKVHNYHLLPSLDAPRVPGTVVGLTCSRRPDRVQGMRSYC